MKVYTPQGLSRTCGFSTASAETVVSSTNTLFDPGKLASTSAPPSAVRGSGGATDSYKYPGDPGIGYGGGQGAGGDKCSGGGRIAFFSEEDFGDNGQSQAESPPNGVSVSPGETGFTEYDEGDGSGTFYDGAALPFLLVGGTVITVY